MGLYRFCLVLMAVCVICPIAQAGDLAGEGLANYYQRHNWRFTHDNLLLPAPLPTVVDEIFGEKEEGGTAARTVTLVINVPSRELTLYEGEKATKRYPVGVGTARYKTPVGPRALSRIVWNPWWLPPDSDWAKDAKDTPPGPRNPLGKAKLPLGEAILLHGTDKPHTVGYPRSHGCLRMKNEDVIELAWWIQQHFSDLNQKKYLQQYQSNWRSSYHVPLKHEIPVEIAYRRVEVRGDELLIHPDIYYRNPDAVWTELLEALAGIGIDGSEIDPERLPLDTKAEESFRIPIQNLLTDADRFKEDMDKEIKLS